MQVIERETVTEQLTCPQTTSRDSLMVADNSCGARPLFSICSLKSEVISKVPELANHSIYLTPWLQPLDENQMLG